MNQQLSKEACEVFQKLLSSVFILSIWRRFRESGNLQEGKVNRNIFIQEMFKELKRYVQTQDYSYISMQFLRELVPDEYNAYCELQKADFLKILRLSADVTKDHLPDQTFEKWFEKKFETTFTKWYKQNFDNQFDKLYKTSLKSLCEKWLEYNVNKLFDSDYFDKWLEQKFNALFERMFERFGLENDEDKIDIQDLVVSLAVLAFMDVEQQLDLIFQLTDVDEDGCLSIQDILNMIKRIERNFMKEIAIIGNDYYTLHHELAYRKAMRKFSWSTIKINKQENFKNDELRLIERKDFLKNVMSEEKLFENFLPHHLILQKVLSTDLKERELDVQDGQFDDFRKKLHGCFRNYQKDKLAKLYLDEYKQQVRYPGKVEQNGKKQTLKPEKYEEKKESKKQEEHSQKKNNQNNIDIHGKNFFQTKPKQQKKDQMICVNKVIYGEIYQIKNLKNDWILLIFQINNIKKIKMQAPEEQDDMRQIPNYSRFLPIANINRIMKKALPENAKIAKDAKETVQECVSEFISFITSEACEKCKNEKRKTINGEDLLFAINTLGFESYVDILKLYLNKYRDAVKACEGQNPSKQKRDRKEDEDDDDDEEDEIDEDDS